MIIRLILAGIIFYLVYRLAQEVFAQKRGTGRRRAGTAAPESEELVKDPNCGIYIPVSQAERRVINGETHYFCSRECSEQYRARG